MSNKWKKSPAGIEQTRIYQKEYREQREYQISQYNAAAVKQRKQEIVEIYGGKCVICEINDPDVLELDHINDDGGSERKKRGYRYSGARHMYYILKKEGFPKDKYQLLCSNCNLKKELKRREEARIKRLPELRRPADYTEILKKLNLL